LGQVARAQARQGAMRAARHTLSEINDDRQLTYAVEQVRGASPLARGGNSMADFDTLINLITTTVEPESWEDLGGPGAIDGFPGGVFVDADGVLRQLEVKLSPDDLSQARRRAARVTDAEHDLARESGLRMVSLPRLEREIQLRRAAGMPLTESMENLAGLREIRYVFVYPESHDLVIAGPAGSWSQDADGRVVGQDGKPVLQFDDLIVLLRNPGWEARAAVR
jgi:hypothetical protein